MSEKRAIAADFTNWRPVVGRRVLQLTLEVPIEETERVLQVLGSPQPGKSLWCGIALIPEPKALIQAKPEASGSPKKFHELPLSQQAAIRCGDVLFQEYLKVESDEDAADYVRCYCGVSSRGEINPIRPSGDRWRDLEAKYQSWLTDRKFAEAKR